MIRKALVLYTRVGVPGIIDQAGLADDTDSSLILLEEIPSFKEAGWHIQDDLLLYKNRLYIQRSLLFRESLRLNHDDPLVSRFGYTRTLEPLCQKY